MFLSRSREAKLWLEGMKRGHWRRMIFKQKLTAGTLLVRVHHRGTASEQRLQRIQPQFPACSYRDNSATIAARGALV